MNLTLGDTVAFSPAVLKRTGNASFRARGVVVGTCGTSAVRVDFQGTWIAHEDGSTIRSVPTANLVKLGQRTTRSAERAAEASWLEGMGV